MSEQDEAPGVVIRDKRRFGPDGELREPPEAPETLPTPSLTDLQAMVDERTSDLQRVKAEYDNYRRRVERDRAVVAEHAVASMLMHMLPVLDDIDRAREHGEVVGGFKSVVDSIEDALAKTGLERFGVVGDPFDPLLHDAITHRIDPDVDQMTCVDILRPGYLFGERLLRPAMVAVAEPPEAEVAAEVEEPADEPTE